jgi:hypothetical protein
MKTKSWLIFFGVLTLCTPVQAESKKKPHGMPSVSCADAWKNLSYSYDYERDISPSALGNQGYEAYANRVQRKSCYKPWTVLVYMAADNNLSPYAMMDLYEMEAGFAGGGPPKSASTLRSDLLVQLDTAASRKIRRFHMFQTPEPYNGELREGDFAKVRESDVRSPIVMSFDEISTQTPKDDLAAFLSWGIQEYPSENYMVVVWGHGQGWTAFSAESSESISDLTSRTFGGLAFDDSDQSFLSVSDLDEVLATVSLEALDGNPIDVYASDACLMQMFEVAYEISEHTRFIVGSTQVQNYLGLPYRRFMTELNSGYFGEKTRPSEKDEAFLVARMIPRLFKLSMEPNGLQGRQMPGANENLSMSALNSEELRNLLAPRLIDLSDALANFVLEDEIRSIDLQFAMQETPALPGSAQDLGAFLMLISNLLSSELRERGTLNPAAWKLRTQIELTQQALQKTVNVFVLGNAILNRDEKMYLLGLRGLSIWLPTTPEEYEVRRVDFGSSAFFQLQRKSSHWSRWFDEIYKTN